MKKIISVLLAAVMIVSSLSISLAAEADTVILYTNDVHCAIDDYAVLAAYKAQLISEGKKVITVDAGDAIQGEVIGTLTKGEAVVDIMNAVGYDYAVPGNHEYDYGMETFLDIAENKAEYEYISSNFYYLPDVKGVFEPYAIKDMGDYQIAFVGITTPETVSKANPDYFKDENNNFIYGFPTWDMKEGVLYENVQESVDAAIAEGADIVVAVGHLGILETTDGWKSTDVIANTNGIDFFIDAHSHETIESAEYKNKDNASVTLSSTGTKFANFGQLTIDGDGAAEFDLITPESIDIEAMSDSAKTVYNTVKAKIDGYNDEISYLYEVIGTSEANLIAYDEDGSWAVRKRETNTGDFVADAYRAVTGADIALCNGGGIRNEIAVGDVTRKMLMDMNPWSNSMCVVEITGQQLIDVLEHGARSCPASLGGFFQVSGVTYEINTWRKTPVITDMNGNFESIDDTMERRVENVLVGGEPVDLDKNYTVAGTQYVLTSGGDGLTMLQGAKVVQQDGLLCDSEMLIKYFTETLGGVIPAEKYGNPDGDGRIEIIKENPDAPEYQYEIKYGETLEVSVAPEADGTPVYVKFVPEITSKYILKSESEGVDTGCSAYNSLLGEVSGEYSDDTEEGYDFRLECEFEAGSIYYLNIFTYSDKTETFSITLECGHAYKNGLCIVCGEGCSHSEIGFLGCCPCGEVFLGTELEDGDEFEYEPTDDSGVMWLRFVPEASGVYTLESFAKSDVSDPVCYLYNVNGEMLTYSDDAEGSDFKLIYDFAEGEIYYFELADFIVENGYPVQFNRATHIGADGNEHDVEYVEETYSDCMTHGYTEGLYCPVCDEYVYGHYEKELDWLHPDENEDEICDLCGAEIDYSDIFPDEPDDEECGHICHSDHWFWSRVWKALNIIFCFLDINRMCECGESHYEPLIITWFPVFF